MNTLFRRLMKNATRLTGKGDLQAATSAIQKALSRSGRASVAAANEPGIHDVIDVAARDLNEPVAPPQPVPRRADATPSPTGKGRFLAGTYSETAAGQRAYKLYAPPEAGTAPLPLIVMLHGCTQNPDDFAAGTAMNELAKAQGFFVLYPEQSANANPQRCWNWFKHSHQARGRGEPALLAGMTREVMARHAIDPARVYVAGLSAGGAMAAILGDAYPDVFAAVGVHSGLASGAAKDLPSALSAMRSASQGPRAAASGVPTIVFHGDADGTVHPGNGQQVIDASIADGSVVEAQQGVSAGGRHYTRQLHRADANGPVLAEHWAVHGSAHAWSGGSAKGSYTDPQGPSASNEMLRFFLEHPKPPFQTKPPR